MQTKWEKRACWLLWSRVQVHNLVLNLQLVSPLVNRYFIYAYRTFMRRTTQGVVAVHQLDNRALITAQNTRWRILFYYVRSLWGDSLLLPIFTWALFYGKFNKAKLRHLTPWSSQKNVELSPLFLRHWSFLCLYLWGNVSVSPLMLILLTLAIEGSLMSIGT